MSDGGGGTLIAVEGIDGAGKSRTARELTAMLKARGVESALVSRRTVAAQRDGYTGEHLSHLTRLIWDYPGTAATSRLGAGHWQHLLAAWFHGVGEVLVRPALAAGRCVVADAWYHKYAARFAVTAGIEPSLRLFTGVPEPDRVLWLDPPPQACLDRVVAPRATERGEWLGLAQEPDGFLAYQQSVRDCYEAMYAPGRWSVCRDASWERVRAWLARNADQVIAMRAPARGATGNATAYVIGEEKSAS